jgi:hypothetical protein
MSRQRWFISTTEAKRIERPRLDPPEHAGSGEADYLGKGC